MKSIQAIPVTVSRTKLSGIGPYVPGYDDNTIIARFEITDGPQAFLDRRVIVQLSVSELVSMLPEEFGKRLAEELNVIARTPIPCQHGE